MPTYEYKCSSCDNQYETREGFDAPARQACPRCGGMAKRLLFPPPIVFKGSGFYITDSRKGSQVTVDSSTPSATSAAEPKADTAPASNGDGASSTAAASTSTSTNHDA